MFRSLHRRTWIGARLQGGIRVRIFLGKLFTLLVEVFKTILDLDREEVARGRKGTNSIYHVYILDLDMEEVLWGDKIA